MKKIKEKEFKEKKHEGLSKVSIQGGSVIEFYDDNLDLAMIIVCIGSKSYYYSAK